MSDNSASDNDNPAVDNSALENVAASSEQTVPAALDNKKAAAPAAPRSRAGIFALVLVILLLPALVGMGWLLLQQQDKLDTAAGSDKTLVDSLAVLQQNYETLRKQNTGEDDRFAALQQAQEQLASSLQATVQQQLTAANNRIAGQAEQLNNLDRSVTELRQRSSVGGNTGSALVMLNEAASLLRLAQQQLLTAADVPAAIQLYTACDTLLQQSSDPAVFPVRETLARELAVLRALPVIDLQGLYVQLGAYDMLIDKLDVVNNNSNDFVVAPASDDLISETRTWFNRATAVLGQYFVVTREAANPVPQMSAEQEYLVRNKVRLQLEQARAALLRGQADIYQATLDAAMASIESRLQSLDGSKEQLLSALTELRNTPIRIEIPALNGTLAALQQVMAATSATGAPK